MHYRHILGLGLLLPLAVPASAQVGQEVFQEVPRGHWAYAVLDRTERLRIATGYPDGTFRGKRLLTRYELAVAVQRVAQSALRADLAATPEGRLRAAVLRKLNLTPVAELPELPRLLVEFTPELRLLGADPDALRHQLDFDAPSPEEVDGKDERRSDAYQNGIKLARKEWEQGQTVLYRGGLAPTLNVDEKLGIPLQSAFGCLVSEEMREQARGHNAEVYRLVLERGLPANNRLRWLGEILHPEQLWKDRTSDILRVSSGNAVTTPGSGGGTVRMKPEQVDQPVRLEIQEKGGESREWPLFRLSRRSPAVDVIWGTPGAHLLTLRYVEEEGKLTLETFVVVDTLTGRPLNRTSAPLAAASE